MHIKIFILIFSFISVFQTSTKPSYLTWEDLKDVRFESRYDDEMEANFWYPEYGNKLNQLELQDVYITGYLVPMDFEGQSYALSAFPYENCFFCGGGGPESVIELRFKKEPKRRFKTDERLTFRGTFKLNRDDPFQLNYILLDSKLYETE